jgi:hypothetical protein
MNEPEIRLRVYGRLKEQYQFRTIENIMFYGGMMVISNLFDNFLPI